MKKILIRTKENGCISINNADGIINKILIKDGIVTFGNKVGVNVDSLVSFEVIDGGV